MQRIYSPPARLALGLGLLTVIGCGQAGPTTYPVHGKVTLATGDPRVLAGSHIEAVLVSDHKVRASGEIQEDGSFRLQALHQGNILDGAVAGTFLVRVILNDDNRKLRQQAARAVPPRFLDFRSSGLSINVPVNGETTLFVSAY